MDKRKWEAPRTMALGELANSLGDCTDGSTATRSWSVCDFGEYPGLDYEDCMMGGLAAGLCSLGQSPD